MNILIVSTIITILLIVITKQALIIHDLKEEINITNNAKR